MEATIKENKEKSQQRNKYATPIAYYCKIDPDQLSQIDSSFSQRFESVGSSVKGSGAPSGDSGRKSTIKESRHESAPIRSNVPSGFASGFTSGLTSAFSDMTMPQILEDSELVSRLFKNGSNKGIVRGKLTDKAEFVRSKLIIDALALEWLKSEQWDKETLIYLVDKLFPVLILGLIKVMGEAERRGLLGKDEPDPNFNPLNYLARYLLRNNPKYGGFNESHPYVCGLRFVAEKLRRKMEIYTGSRLGFLKMEANKRRRHCEMEQLKRNQEKQRRINALRELFYSWNEGKRIPLIMTQNALLSFKHREASFGYNTDEGLILPPDWLINPTGETYLLADRFIDYIMVPAMNLTPRQFNDFVRHMEMAGVDFKDISRRNEVTYQLQQLFHNCDVVKIEYLDKAKVMNLLRNFYMRNTVAMQEKLNNPKYWPFSQTRELPDDPEFVEGELPDWMILDLSMGIFPPDDYILEECPPDKLSVEILKTPVWKDMPYVDFFTKENVKFATLDFQRYQEMEMLKCEMKKDDMKNIKILPLAPNRREIYIFGPKLRIKEKVEQGNKLDFLPIWKLVKVREMDKESGLISRNHFCGLVMNFLGPAIDNQGIINRLGVFFVEGCKMNDEEKVAMLYKWKELREKEKANLDISETFELWDSNVSGYLPLAMIMEKLKATRLFSEPSLEFDVLKAYQNKYGQDSNKITKAQFKYLLGLAVKLLPENTTPEAFLKNFFSTYDPGPVRLRSVEAKKRLIHHILLQATYSPNDMRPVFQEALSVMKKDDYEMTSDKFVSATISLLERRKSGGHEFDYMLRLHAKTSDKKYADVGTCMEPHPSSQSYKVIKTKEMVIIQKLQQHPNPLADLWDRNVREEISEGQMIFIPLMDEQKRVFGVFAVDNIPVIMLSEDEKRISNVEGKIAFKGGAEDSSVYEVIKFEIPAASKMSSRVSFSFRKSVQIVPSTTQSRSMKIPSAIPPTEIPVSKTKLPKIGSGINFPLPDVEVSAASSSDQFRTRDSVRTRRKSKSRFGIDRSKALRRVSLTEELSTIRDEKIEFFQGIGKALSITLHQHCQFVKIRKCYMTILESFSFLCPSVTWCGVYRVAYDISIADVFLQEIMTYVFVKDQPTPLIDIHDGRLPILERMQNLYRPFVFSCVDSGNPIFGSSLGENYFAFPIKDLENQVKFIFVVNIGNKPKLMKLEMVNLVFYEKFFTKMFHHVIIMDKDLTEEVRVIVNEKEEEPIEMLCWNYCLQELYQRLAKYVNGENWYRLACMDKVPPRIKNIFTVVLQLLGPRPQSNPQWREIAPYLAGNILKKVRKFKQKRVTLTEDELEDCSNLLKDIPIQEFYQTNFPPLVHFYEWALISMESVERYREYQKLANVPEKPCSVI